MVPANCWGKPNKLRGNDLRWTSIPSIRKKVADQASALADLLPRVDVHFLVEIQRAHTRCGALGGPSFSAARQTAPGAQSFQIRPHPCQRGQRYKEAELLIISLYQLS